MKATLCAIRDINRAMAVYAQNFEAQYGISLNEGMLLCCVGKEQLTAGDIAARIDLTTSNCSKVIKTVEDKGYLQRSMGTADKRQMFFSLSTQGHEILNGIYHNQVPMPDLLQSVFEQLWKK